MCNMSYLVNHTSGFFFVCFVLFCFFYYFIQIPTSLESSGERLAQSLARLSDRAQQVGFTTWLESLSDRTNS